MPATDSGTLATAAPADSSNTRYTQPETPFALASTGDVGLLSFNWLADQAQAGAVLPRRQELPPEAFADVDALRAMHAAAPAHVAAAVLPMLSVSYCWLEARHPDGEGEQLKHIVGTLEPHAEAWREFFDDMGVFLDWCSIYQKDPALFDARETPEAKPEGAPMPSPRARRETRSSRSSTRGARGTAARRTRTAARRTRRRRSDARCTRRWTSGTLTR